MLDSLIFSNPTDVTENIQWIRTSEILLNECVNIASLTRSLSQLCVHPSLVPVDPWRLNLQRSKDEAQTKLNQTPANGETVTAGCWTAD